MRNKIALGLVLMFAVLQLFNPEKVGYSKPTEKDIFNIEQVDEQVKLIVQKACYDCHSDQVSYPWYASIAPISFWIQDHIDHAREHLNFSDWGEYSKKKKAHKAEESYEEIKEGEMPLNSYTLVHREANLSDEEKETLEKWFQSLQEKYR